MLTPGKTGVPMVVSELYNEKMDKIDGTSHPYMRFFMPVPCEVKVGDIIRAC